MIGKSINVNISSDLDPIVYNVPITLKTYIPKRWENISINKDQIIHEVQTDANGKFVTYSVLINQSKVIIKEG